MIIDNLGLEMSGRLKSLHSLNQLRAVFSPYASICHVMAKSEESQVLRDVGLMTGFIVLLRLFEGKP